MLKENEKRVFWIVVMAVAVVSLVSAWVSSFVISLEGFIDNADWLGKYEDVDYDFSTAVLLLAMFALVAAAVAHLATKGKNCNKAKIIWAAIIGGYFLLSSLVLGIIYYTVVSNYNSMMTYVTTTLTMAISYELAFIAQWMLNRQPKAAETDEAPKNKQNEN